MKQFQIAYCDENSFREELAKIQQWCDTNPSYTTLFRIFSADLKLIGHICRVLDERMPDALYVGCTSHANMLDGALNLAPATLSCTIFEYETTQVKLLQFPFTEENEKEVAQQLQAYCEANPWVTSIELYATILGLSAQEFCDEMKSLRSDIQVFGGGACNPVLDDITNYVFSSGNGITSQGIVFLLYGGSDLHTYSTFISGWTPLRRKFKVTKAHRDLLSELDGIPAFRIYKRFLNIENNADLVPNTLDFPILMDRNGVDVMRCILAANEDDSVVLTAEIEEGIDIRLSYGDPDMILANIKRDGQYVANFRPDVILAFSCGARKAFWGDDAISNETTLFHNVAPTSGFYTGGEFLRVGGFLHHFNCTLVLAAMREGEPKTDEIKSLYDATLDENQSKRIALVQRFISFIEASTADFEESNQQLEELNRRLTRSSITDGMTGLYNRTEIERGIINVLNMYKGTDISLVMLDLDNFKRVNDTYGHKEGDHVIIALSDVLREVFDGIASAYTGRWGGEEFMVLLPGCTGEEAVAYAEQVRTKFSALTYDLAPSQTVSIGVTQAADSDTCDSFCSRVDKALYTAKANGKNQVVQV